MNLSALPLFRLRVLDSENLLMGFDGENEDYTEAIARLKIYDGG